MGSLSSCENKLDYTHGVSDEGIESRNSDLEDGRTFIIRCVGGILGRKRICLVCLIEEIFEREMPCLKTFHRIKKGIFQQKRGPCLAPSLSHSLCQKQRGNYFGKVISGSLFRSWIYCGATSSQSWAPRDRAPLF